jgi:1,4-dihydroxy-2-naphthoate polyprenyltransferase
MTRAWIHAFRLRTLPLALACIGMGGFLFGLCCLTTIFLQVLSNLANDYGDSMHGADHEGRKGPTRAVQSGIISASQMRNAVILFAVLSLGCGLLLLWVSFGTHWDKLILFLGLGMLSIVAAIGYTVGKKPYGYLGLGDVSVLIFFGFVGVLGSYYLFTHTLTPKEILPALSCGFFSIAVLNINNIRDIDSDRQAGKFSIPVRIGKAKAVRYHWFLLAGGILSACGYLVLQYRSPWQWLFILSVPLLIKNGISVNNRPSEELDPFLKQMALSTLLFVLLFGLGLIL